MWGKKILLIVAFIFIACIPISFGLITFSNAYPNNQQTTYNPRLAVKIADSNNGNLIIEFQTNVTGSWQTVGNYNGNNDFYSQPTNNIDAKKTKYKWRIRVYDGINWTEKIYFFWTDISPFMFKWKYELQKDMETPPLSADINGDGIYEVIVAGEDKIVVLNGSNGNVIWSKNNSLWYYHQPIDIADLNKDGVPEIVVPSGWRTIALHANDGSVYWDVPVSSMDKHPIIVDTEGTGYPYVYVVDYDILHGANGTGRLRKLRGTDGAVVAQVFAWKPSFGGLSAADKNNDGKFEIYLCDRKTGYEPPPGGLGKGMQAYHADNLSLIWHNGDVTCSSHMQALIDVNNDNVLDSVAMHQFGSNGGICIWDGAANKTMTGKCNLNMNMSNDEPFSISDTDGDGHIEFVTAKYSTAQVWDITSWTKVATLDYFVEPPKLVDVIGDSKLEIVGAYTHLFVYNGTDYSLIEKINNVNTTSNFIVQDIDNDNQNELIFANDDGTIRVYDTPAYSTAKKLRTEHMYYSERRLGAGVYVPPAGAPQPFIKNEFPKHNAQNIQLNPTLKFFAVDYRHDRIDVSIYTNVTGSWTKVAEWINVSNGNYSYTPSNMNTPGKEYNWKAIVTDSYADDITAQKIFKFKTASGNNSSTWKFRKKITINKLKVSGTSSNFPVLVSLDDLDISTNAKSDGSDILFIAGNGITKLNHEIESYETGKVVAWVKTNISSSSNTTMYLYFGNLNAAPQENPAGVWDSNFLLVQHLEEETGVADDSTSNNFDSTPTSGVTQGVTGKINGAYEFDGVTGRLILSKILSTQTKFTFEGWVNSGNKEGYAISQRDTSSIGSVILYKSGNYSFYVNDKYRGFVTAPNEWHYVAGTFNGTTAKFYLDNKTATFGASITWPNVATVIGDRANTLDRQFLGKLDEIRISKIARDSNYIKNSYNNQKLPSAFYSIGSLENVNFTG